MDLSRQQVVEAIGRLELEWGDEEDASALVDLLLEAHTTVGAMSWLCFWSDSLGGVPLELVAKGRSRDVFREVRGMVEARSRVQL